MKKRLYLSINKSGYVKSIGWCRMMVYKGVYCHGRKNCNHTKRNV